MSKLGIDILEGVANTPLLDMTEVKNTIIDFIDDHMGTLVGSKIKNLLLKDSYFEDPASSRFHLARKGGLALHSLLVLDSLIRLRNAFVMLPKVSEISLESMMKVALLHDMCKVGTYKVESRKTPEELDSINKRKSNQLSFSYLWDTVEDQTTELSGNFYIIKLREGLYKIGITTKPSGAFARYRKHDLDGREVILNESLSTIREAFRIEQIMRREFNGRIKKENAVGVFGWTETIEIDEETLLDKYKNLFENKEKTKQIFANIRNKQ
jgi:hypothetical protein